MLREGVFGGCCGGCCGGGQEGEGGRVSSPRSASESAGRQFHINMPLFLPVIFCGTWQKQWLLGS